MTFGSLFAGVGGMDLGLERAGMECRWQVEIADYCNKVLEKHWPHVKRYRDIRSVCGAFADTKLPRSSRSGRDSRSKEALDASINSHQANILEPVDLICGGFPCQPFSVAGKRGGAGDNRFLWPEMLRVISEVRPAWVLGENVANIVNMALEQVFVDLENEGYEVQPIIIPACAVNAPHRRDRVWIIAYNTNIGRRNKGQIGEMAQGQITESAGSDSDAADTDNIGVRCDQRGQGQGESARGSWNENWYEVATRLCRVDDGLPRRLDKSRVNRLKCLGNAVVPQIVEIIGRAIMAQKRTSTTQGMAI